MDWVVGNPPYVRVHNLGSSAMDVKRQVFSQGGMTDLYLSFYAESAVSHAIPPCVILTAFASYEEEIRAKPSRAGRGGQRPRRTRRMLRPPRTCGLRVARGGAVG